MDGAPEADGGQKQRAAGAAVLELARGPALLLPMATTSGGADARAEVAAPPNMVTRWRSVAGGRIDIVRVELVLDFIGTRSDGAVRVRLLTLVAALPSGPWGRAAPHPGAGGGGGCGEGGGGAGGGGLKTVGDPGPCGDGTARAPCASRRHRLG